MMDIKKVFLLILFQGMVNVDVFAVEENSTSSRSAYFTTRKNVRLKGHMVKRFESASSMSCSNSCLKHSWCTSTNFMLPSGMNDKGTCELNKHSILDIHTKIHEEQGVTFTMHLKVIKLLVSFD